MKTISNLEGVKMGLDALVKCPHCGDDTFMNEPICVNCGDYIDDDPVKDYEQDKKDRLRNELLSGNY